MQITWHKTKAVFSVKLSSKCVYVFMKSFLFFFFFHCMRKRFCSSEIKFTFSPSLFFFAFWILWRRMAKVNMRRVMELPNVRCVNSWFYDTITLLLYYSILWCFVSLQCCFKKCDDHKCCSTQGWYNRWPAISLLFLLNDLTCYHFSFLNE